MKRAQGMPVNVVIIAALALLVLFILMYITAGKLQWFGKGTSEAAKVEVCPPAQIKSIAECENALVGNYGQPDPADPKKTVPLGFNKVCCSP